MRMGCPVRIMGRVVSSSTGFAVGRVMAVTGVVNAVEREDGSGECFLVTLHSGVKLFVRVPHDTRFVRQYEVPDKAMDFECGFGK